MQTNLSLSLYIYIYIDRERERDLEHVLVDYHHTPHAPFELTSQRCDESGIEAAQAHPACPRITYYVCIYTHVCTCICMCIYIYIYIHHNMYVCMCMYVYVCMCVYV